MKTAIITGATSGIGIELVRGMAAKGYRLGIVGRDPQKTDSFIQTLKTEFKGLDIIGFNCDLSELPQIKTLAEQIRQKFSSLDVLINNAGAVFSNFQTNSSGIEMTVATNHISVYALTNMLLPLLKNAASARIVITGSGSQYQVRSFDSLDVFTEQKSFNSTMAYARSKLCNGLFTMVLAEKLKGSNITVNAYHPGLVKTPIGHKNTSWLVARLWDMITMIGGISPEQGAKTGVYLATAEEVHGISGKFWDKCKEREYPPIATKELANRVWKKTEELTQIRTW